MARLLLASAAKPFSPELQTWLLQACHKVILLLEIIVRNIAGCEAAADVLQSALAVP